MKSRTALRGININQWQDGYINTYPELLALNSGSPWTPILEDTVLLNACTEIIAGVAIWRNVMHPRYATIWSVPNMDAGVLNWLAKVTNAEPSPPQEAIISWVVVNVWSFLILWFIASFWVRKTSSALYTWKFVSGGTPITQKPYCCSPCSDCSGPKWYRGLFLQPKDNLILPVMKSTYQKHRMDQHEPNMQYTT